MGGSSPCVVLIVDDDANSGYIFGHVLEHVGCVVHQVGSAIHALEFAQTHAPDVILMDYHLPGMNGWDATRALRTDPRTHAIPVIATTAYALADIETQARAAGVSGFLPKPTAPVDIVSEVARLAPRCVLRGFQGVSVEVMRVE